MNELKQRFLDLSPRDQLFLVGGAGILLVFILLFGVLFPMQDELAKARKQNASALKEQQEVRSLAGRVLASQQGAQGGNQQQSLNGLLNKTLSQHELTMENFQPSGNQARVRLSSSDFNKVFAWMHELEIKHGVNIKDVTITSDQSPGSVLVNLQLVWGS